MNELEKNRVSKNWHYFHYKIEEALNTNRLNDLEIQVDHNIRNRHHLNYLKKFIGSKRRVFECNSREVKVSLKEYQKLHGANKIKIINGRKYLRENGQLVTITDNFEARMSCGQTKDPKYDKRMRRLERSKRVEEFDPSDCWEGV